MGLLWIGTNSWNAMKNHWICSAEMYNYKAIESKPHMSNYLVQLPKNMFVYSPAPSVKSLLCTVEKPTHCQIPHGQSGCEHSKNAYKLEWNLSKSTNDWSRCSTWKASFSSVLSVSYWANWLACWPYMMAKRYIYSVCNYMQIAAQSKPSVEMNKNKSITSNAIYFYWQSNAWSRTTIKLFLFEADMWRGYSARRAPAVISTPNEGRWQTIMVPFLLTGFSKTGNSDTP